jgi:hypothetical protein
MTQALVAGGVAHGLGGHIVGEVVREAADDGCGGGSVPSLEAADSGHVIHRASAWHPSALPFTGGLRVRRLGRFT